MKKLFLLMMAVCAMTLVSCGDKAKSGESAEEVAALTDGNAFDGKSYTFTYPKEWKETYKSDDNLNAGIDDIQFDATFSDYPCKPEDFNKFVENLEGMEMFKDFKWEDAKINGDILTFKGVNGDNVENKFVVYLGEKAGVAGTFKYPVAKANEVEALIMPILKSMKKK